LATSRVTVSKSLRLSLSAWSSSGWTLLYGTSFRPIPVRLKASKIVAKSVLEALATFHDLNGVHTEVNPNNIFVSGIHDPYPIVKLGDLGNRTLVDTLTRRGDQG